MALSSIGNHGNSSYMQHQNKLKIKIKTFMNLNRGRLRLCDSASGRTLFSGKLGIDRSRGLIQGFLLLKNLSFQSPFRFGSVRQFGGISFILQCQNIPLKRRSKIHQHCELDDLQILMHEILVDIFPCTSASPKRRWCTGHRPRVKGTRKIRV